MYLLFAVFDLVTLAADCVLSRIVILTSICDLVTCVLNWCQIIFLFVFHPEVTRAYAVDGSLKSKHYY